MFYNNPEDWNETAGGAARGPMHSQATPVLTVTNDERVETLYNALQRALAMDGPQSVKLSGARTIVAFCCGGGEDRVVALLDRKPNEVTMDGGAAEIEIHLTDEQVDEFCRGELNIPLAASVGDVISYGPVRKYLVVDAILRDRLRAARKGS